MNRPIPTVYFAALSTVDLVAACSALQVQLAVGPFATDTEDSWEYAIAETDDYFVNLTRTTRTDTIASWMPAAPEGVNWQVIVRTEQEDLMRRIKDVLEQVLGASLRIYHVAQLAA